MACNVKLHFALAELVHWLNLNFTQCQLQTSYCTLFRFLAPIDHFRHDNVREKNTGEKPYNIKQFELNTFIE